MPRPNWNLMRFLLAQAVKEPPGDAVPDLQLLNRYQSTRDTAAFELIVRRHADLVYGVCRRVCRDEHDAEDAFQAAFLVLARKAGRVRSNLTGWLHRTAYRTALRASRRRRRIHNREMELSVEPAAHTPGDPFELRAMLDAEINRLPRRLRVAVIHCCIEGRTAEEAAAWLAIPVGTIYSRLANARKRLAQGLARRGVTASVTLASLTAALNSETATASFLAATSAAILKPVAGSGAALLSLEVLRMMAWKTTIAWSAGIAFICALGTGTSFVLAQNANPKPQPPAEARADEKPKRQDTEAGRLLNKLDELRPKMGKDEWASVIRDLIQLGPQATPDIIAELDATNDDYMLRCLGFVSRGIKDKRAVPALIRALPKTCKKTGSDYGLTSDDSELQSFMLKHDLTADDKQKGETHYDFGRSVREICGSLQALTGEKKGDDEIRNVSLDGSPAQQYQQRLLYQRCAERWSRWWDANWNKHVDDKAFSIVNLKPLKEEHHERKPFPRNGVLGTHHSGHILESVRNPKAKYVFLDLDTGRGSGLPEQFKALADDPERLDDILAWAAREGFDLMGTEYKPSPRHEPHFVLRGLGLTLWHNPPERWKALKDELRGDKPIEMGTRTDGLLCLFSEETARYDAEATATFLFTTREGGHGAIFVGVEVHDNSLQPGGIGPVNNELSPIAFYKGRRFAYCSILEPKP